MYLVNLSSGTDNFRNDKPSGQGGDQSGTSDTPKTAIDHDGDRLEPIKFKSLGREAFSAPLNDHGWLRSDLLSGSV